MPNFKIKVKWGKEIFQDVEVNTDEEPMVFKAQLFALTGVQPERQKVMLKGAILDQTWDKVRVKDGIMMLMMGTKDEDMPSQPVEKTKFVEDMDERELSRAMDMPAGLQVKLQPFYFDEYHRIVRLVIKIDMNICLESRKYVLSQRHGAVPQVCSRAKERPHQVLSEREYHGRRRGSEHDGGAEGPLQDHGWRADSAPSDPAAGASHGLPSVCRKGRGWGISAARCK